MSRKHNENSIVDQFIEMQAKSMHKETGRPLAECREHVRQELAKEKQPHG